MPSVGTQTTWSYLHDGPSACCSHCASCSSRQPHRLSPAAEYDAVADDGLDEDDRVTESCQQSVEMPTDSQAVMEGSSVEAEPMKEDDLLPSKDTLPSVAAESDGHRLDTLPSVAAESNENELDVLNNDGGSLEDCRAKNDGACLPPEVITQLDELHFPSDDSDVSSEDEQEESPPVLVPDISSTRLSLPAVLQYLRESESLASSYFSLSNVKEVSERRPEKPTQPTDPGRHIEAHGMDGLAPPQGNGMACDFCGELRPIVDIWSYAGHFSTNEESPFCCTEHQEFCLLAAAYMRQELQRRLQKRPQKIAIDPRRRKTFKKTAEERALAMMRRKKKWEELKKKRLKQLQSSSFYSLTKQTKTIQFSLLSPTAGQRRWVVRPDTSTRARRGQRRRGRGRERGRTVGDSLAGTRGELPTELLDRLRQEAAVPGSLDRQIYDNGRPFATILPDGTGQCFYPSGRLALCVFTPHPGTHSYLAFEDCDQSKMLACIDELGAACCYNPNGSMRMLFTACQGSLYDGRGNMKLAWSWKHHTPSPMFQPISLNLNRHFHFRCSSRDNMTLTFSAPPHFIKFNISCKISHKDMESTSIACGQKQLVDFQGQLKQAQTTIKHLLHTLQYAKKLSQLQSVYTPYRRVGNHGNSRKRTRSTGALTGLYSNTHTLRPSD